MHVPCYITLEDAWRLDDDDDAVFASNNFRAVDTIIEDTLPLDLAHELPDQYHAEVEMQQPAADPTYSSAIQIVQRFQWLGRTIGARIDQNEPAATGLYEAIRRDNAEVANYLLSSILSMQQVHFEMAIHYRAYSILQLYLDRGWNINAYSSRMHPTALSLAVQNPELTLWLLHHGADPNAACGLDITPLSIAVRDAAFEIIRTLFGHGGSVHRGQLLHFAALRSLPDRLHILEYVLDKGAPVNDIMFQRNAASYEHEKPFGLGTPLHLAASIGCLAMVDMLLSRGADPSIKDSRGKLAVEEAEFHDLSAVVDRLRSYS